MQETEAHVIYSIPKEGMDMLTNWKRLFFAFLAIPIETALFGYIAITRDMDTDLKTFLVLVFIVSAIIPAFFLGRNIVRYFATITYMEWSGENISVEKFRSGKRIIDSRLPEQSSEIAHSVFRQFKLVRVKAIDQAGTEMYRLKLPGLKDSFIILTKSSLETLSQYNENA